MPETTLQNDLSAIIGQAPHFGVASLMTAGLHPPEGTDRFRAVNGILIRASEMKSVFLVSTILAAATLVQPAVAQEGAPAAETGVAAHDEGEGAIVDKARRREESLQSIQYAVSAQAQVDLYSASAHSIPDVHTMTHGPRNNYNLRQRRT